MSFEDSIRRERANMSKSFAKLADFLVNSYTEASFMTASELAHVLNLDAATVVRFAQALGYTGFPQLQREIRQKVKNDLLIRPRQAEVSQSIPGVAATLLRELAKDLEQTRITLDTRALEELVEQIGRSSRILLIADPPAQSAADNLAYSLQQAGFLVDQSSPQASDLARLLYTASTQDLLLALEIRGETPSIVLAAHTHPAAASGTLLVQILVYVLVQTLRSRYAQRFAQAEQAAAQIVTHLQKVHE